ncbi:glycerol-3-phosphate dehydrogenase/oxidase [Pseudoalteromonas denitrificans]|uniref:Glycerol-3-phosphate dehydrogenase n=1 Tax=Pseudoalteromonas denitrificans DSM 6059 TaxID=1123010 RepID=A0A1I1NEQ4_9GAMM|nr:glycerol-3-phosphate dehydrogenase/oxidase [Pseudoalteromonas denitrificans]SFC96161.1 glycerol-3-phosphate dehydrogenase [Pseudoalteromonas denitrificans DSM 6059]
MTDNFKLSRNERIALIKKQTQWDIVIVGGGITGAGILKLASQLGLSVLLLEKNDFAWGSSSRSSKMVHGGLRYIADGHVALTVESVKEREHLTSHSQGLVFNQSFIMSHFKYQFPQPWIFNSLLSVYDFIAGVKQHHYVPQQEFKFLAPNSKLDKANGGSQFVDAMTDDARLVLRLLQESQSKQSNVLAINYLGVDELTKENGQVTGVVVKLEDENTPLNIKAKFVINATGAWTNQFNQTTPKVKIRPLRGSHILVPNWCLPVASAMSVLHPLDKRPVQIYPWENVTVIGTTDVEHIDNLKLEPKIDKGEFSYLMQCIKHQFPKIKLTEKDIISTFSGIRPVVTNGRTTKPSKEKRDHTIWYDKGLINIAGGKLTTFRVIAKQVLDIVYSKLNRPINKWHFCAFEQNITIVNTDYSNAVLTRLRGNFGALSNEVLLQSELMRPISYSNTLWAEVLWSIKNEQVKHLDDLLLRRTRLGNVLPNGAFEHLDNIKPWVMRYLKWDQNKWESEVSRYQKIWQTCYSNIAFNNKEAINESV